MKNAVHLATALFMIILRPALTESAAPPPNPWLTTKQTRVLELRCTIPVHMALRDQWRYVDGIHITFQPHIRYSGNKSLALVRSSDYDVPRRGEDLHPMAEVEGLVSVSELSDPRPHHLSVLTPFDLDAGDAGIYYCVVNYTDSARERHSLSYKINVDAKLVYESFDAADGCFAGKIATADELTVTWPWTRQGNPQSDDLTLQRIIVDKTGRAISDPRTLLTVHQKNVQRNSDVILAKLFPPEFYTPGDSNYTVRAYAAHEACYPYCKYSCLVAGRQCGDGIQELTSSASGSPSCAAPWILFSVSILALIAIIVIAVLWCKCKTHLKSPLKCCNCCQGEADSSSLNSELAVQPSPASNQDSHDIVANEQGRKPSGGEGARSLSTERQRRSDSNRFEHVHDQNAGPSSSTMQESEENHASVAAGGSKSSRTPHRTGNTDIRNKFEVVPLLTGSSDSTRGQGSGGKQQFSVTLPTKSNGSSGADTGRPPTEPGGGARNERNHSTDENSVESKSLQNEMGLNVSEEPNRLRNDLSSDEQHLAVSVDETVPHGVPAMPSWQSGSPDESRSDPIQSCNIQVEPLSGQMESHRSQMQAQGHRRDGRPFTQSPEANNYHGKAHAQSSQAETQDRGTAGQQRVDPVSSSSTDMVEEQSSLSESEAPSTQLEEDGDEHAATGGPEQSVQMKGRYVASLPPSQDKDRM